jgi:hypothetical protein
MALSGPGAALAVPPQTPPGAPPRPVAQNPNIPGVCLKPPTQPPLTYDTSVCCKLPDTWQRGCVGWTPHGGVAVCTSPAYVCTAPGATPL